MLAIRGFVCAGGLIAIFVTCVFGGQLETGGDVVHMCNDRCTKYDYIFRQFYVSVIRSYSLLLWKEGKIIVYQCVYYS